MSQGRRTRHELHKHVAHEYARKAREEAALLRKAWDDYVAKGAALAAIRPCGDCCPDFAQDVAPVVCQLLQGHAPGEGDAGHRHRILGSQVVVTW